MTQSPCDQLNALCDYLATRRQAILLAWRKASGSDPGQTTAHSLTRGQFNDHVPEVLDAFERKLRSRPGGAEARAAGVQTKQEEVKHGLHRWQQGYRLQELMHEWGHLQICLFEEIESFAAIHPELTRGTLMEANRQMISLVNEAISESTAQYERMQKAEAAGRIGDLTGALASINEFERRRADLIHQAVHDLHNDVAGVSMAASVLGRTGITEIDRAELATVLGQGVQAVTSMLGELMELARLEAGQEYREITTFDAAVLVTELSKVNQPIARERGLFLQINGPPELSVEGDHGRVRRLLQNLLVNALKYTEHGGVTLSWGEERENWWLMVRDTGSGMSAVHGAPMAVGLKEATASARESDEKAAAIQGETSHVLAPSEGAPVTAITFQKKPGEGIGLSIVKRLCELLDASLEMASSTETGTTFRVVLPRNY
ncbi:MAG: HAMP domain-containing histidine kinase [Opitutaceae bacterium]|nr:HAMP domain-containing histidine kinase [Verrucomicrobiales bacterium]